MKKKMATRITSLLMVFCMMVGIIPAPVAQAVENPNIITLDFSANGVNTSVMGATIAVNGWEIISGEMFSLKRNI